MHHVGNTIDGQKLMGSEAEGVRRYYLNEKLVAIALGNLEETSLTRYYCISGIWEPDHQTWIVSDDDLFALDIA